MNIRDATAEDCDALRNLWLRSVSATHLFLSEREIQELLPHVDKYLGAALNELSILCAGDGAIMGFMGMSGNNVDALFLDPVYFGRGGGRKLLEHARSRSDDLTVDVSEQNPRAVRFYEAFGFVVVGRSEHDSAGRPYPLLHMRLPRGQEGK